jgi:hypothetical protein
MPLALIVIYSMTLYLLLRMLDLECEPFHSYDNFGNGSPRYKSVTAGTGMKDIPLCWEKPEGRNVCGPDWLVCNPDFPTIKHHAASRRITVLCIAAQKCHIQ